MTEMIVLATAGRYRLRLEIQEDSQDCDPRTDQDCNLTSVITPTQSRYTAIDKEGGPLQYGWDHFSVRPDSERLFIRWARMVHGVTVIEDRPHDGAWALWYVMPDKVAETTVTPKEIIEAEIKEYRTWAEGEVYGYVIERATEWEPKAGQFEDGDEPDSMTTWEHIDSCWGYIGREYAETSARDEFASYAEGAGK